MSVVTCSVCKRRFISETLAETRLPGFGAREGFVFVSGPEGPSAAFCHDCTEKRDRALPPLEEYARRWLADFRAPRTDLDEYIFEYHRDAIDDVDNRAAEVIDALRTARLNPRDTTFAWRTFADPEIQARLAEGPRAHYRAAAERALMKHRDSIVLNCCPRCHALCRTPRARQCRRCYHGWRSQARGRGTAGARPGPNG